MTEALGGPERIQTEQLSDTTLTRGTLADGTKLDHVAEAFLKRAERLTETGFAEGPQAIERASRDVLGDYGPGAQQAVIERALELNEREQRRAGDGTRNPQPHPLLAPRSRAPRAQERQRKGTRLARTARGGAIQLHRFSSLRGFPTSRSGHA
jgi:hypothetical protein